MKRTMSTFGLAILIAGSLFAQTVPQGMNYQAVARDLNGNVKADQALMLEVRLSESGKISAASYIELHEVRTNQLGLFTIIIGEGMPLQSNFTDVKWSTEEIWLEIAIDMRGEGTFDVVHNSKLLAVPYALHAGTASKVHNDPSHGPDFGIKYWRLEGNAGTDADEHFVGTTDSTDLVFRTNDVEHMRIGENGDVIMQNGLDVKGEVKGGLFIGDGSGLTNLPGDADADPTNELQTLSQAGTDITLSDGGGTVSVADNDNDPSNEFQTLGLSGNMLTLSNGGGTVNLGADSDNDPTNEIQTLSQSGLDVTLSDGGGVISVADNDNDPANEYQTISKVGSDITLSDGGGTVSVDDDDSDVTNELQDLSISGDTLILSGDPTPVSLSSFLVDTDDQMLSLAGFELSITDGNTITIPNAGGGGGLWSSNAPDVFYTGGNVGIGTSVPAGELEINANSSLSSPHILLHENGNDYARVNFDNNNGTNYWTIAAYIASNVRNDRLNFWNGTSGDLLSLTGDGRLGLNVGISPKTTFHVGNGKRVLFGIDTLGNGDKLMWLPDLHAFRVGTVATGAASTYWNRDSIGLYSFASGLNTRAQGFGATATGRDTEATNSYAFASGFFSNADGQYSTAMGFNTDAFALGSTALGYSTDAEKNYSFAAGYFAEAQAIYSVAIGNAVRAQSYASMAVGRYNVGGGSSTSWLSSDPIFEIGIGTGPSTRANAITVRKNGNVGIGTTIPLDKLHVNGRIRLQTVEYIEDGGTSEIKVRGDLRPSSNNIYDIGTSSFRWDDVYATNGTINTSDLRDKTNIQQLPYGLKEVLRLQPVSYEWKDAHYGQAKLGLIAQDVLEVLPEVVKTHDWESGEAEGEGRVEELDRLGIYYSDIIPVLINAIQDQNQLIEEQGLLIKEQKGAIEDLKSKFEMLEKIVNENRKSGKVAMRN